MKSHVYDYPLPNGVFAFWFFLGPILGFFAIGFAKLVNDIKQGFLNFEVVQFTFFLVISCALLVFVVLIIINSFPAIRIDSDGIEVRFYVPFFTRWVLIPWDSIHRIQPILSPSNSLIGNKKFDLFIYSDRLPNIYFIPSIIWEHTIDRGFLIGNRIRDFQEIDNRIKSKMNY